MSGKNAAESHQHQFALHINREVDAQKPTLDGQVFLDRFSGPIDFTDGERIVLQLFRQGP